MNDLRQVTVVGTGLLGGSIGLGLRARGYEGAIIGVGRRQATLDDAARLGCIDRGVTDLAEACAEADLVILATPLGVFPALLRELAGVTTQAVVTDVGSTKQQVCREARARLGAGIRFVGSHPMAGSERHGPTHARADLFEGRPCVVTPEEHTDAEALQAVEGLWTRLGMQLLRMTPAEHDRKVARISHLPHAVASLLVQLVDRYGGWEVASSGFRDTTRVASGEPNLWRDIFASNRTAVLEAVDALGDELSAFRQWLGDADDDAIHAMLDGAKQSRDAWAARVLDGAEASEDVQGESSHNESIQIEESQDKDG